MAPNEAGSLGDEQLPSSQLEGLAQRPHDAGVVRHAADERHAGAIDLPLAIGA